MKRWIFGVALCLCVCLLVGGLVGRAEAADIVASGKCGDDLTWTLDNEGTLTISGSGEMSNPSWSSAKDPIKAVVIENGVTSIGDSAFLGCSDLTSVTVPESVTSIGGYAFSGCTSLASISIPKSVTNIGADAFFNCPSMNGIWVAEDNPNYSSDRFGVLYDKDKTELLKCPERILGTYTVAERVAKIHFRAFFHCGLSKILVAEGNPCYSSDEKGVLYNKDKTTLIVCPSGLSGAYTVPAGVTEIELWAFYGCADLTDVTLPETVTRIKSYAFWDCTGLMRVTIPEGVTSIGHLAFRGCTRLTSVTIPESMVSIDYQAFFECTGLKTVIFLGEKLRIWSSAFEGVTAEAYYPESTSEDSFWLQEGALGDYGGSLTWRQWYTLGNDPLCSHVLEDAVVPASCAEEGYTLHKCACGYSYRTDFLTALGHDYIDHEAKAATCTEIGWAAYQTCSRCEYTTYKEIPAKGHTPAAAVRENGIDATCTKNGSYDEVIYCSVCHAEQGRESRTIPALGHDYIDHEAKAATCT